MCLAHKLITKERVATHLALLPRPRPSFVSPADALRRCQAAAPHLTNMAEVGNERANRPVLVHVYVYSTLREESSLLFAQSSIQSWGLLLSLILSKGTPISVETITHPRLPM